ncbi:putative ribosomal RNA small subunit methyltransferase NEP1 [Trifolium medium]|uniref:Putative ribosomal RNA small subunit methyltransferase NEP1 n=1 Tax=Trifolium medium TaxID=97028 RepID=A0A392NH36_9FABA|nr:putative ribosomal RNA small subunit methyltransferase NEP1 [Trifolium medium]
MRKKKEKKKRKKNRVYAERSLRQKEQNTAIAPPTENNSDRPCIIFILERASLEVAKVGKTYQLLNSDELANFLCKNNKNPAHYRHFSDLACPGTMNTVLLL